MEIKKIIKICKILELVAIVFEIGAIVWMFWDWCNHPNYLMYILLIALFGVIINTIKEWNEEKLNPLSLNKQKSAIEYARQKIHGKKEEFIKEHGKDIYNYFVDRGYIHPPLDYDGTQWEITALGQNVRERWIKE